MVLSSFGKAVVVPNPAKVGIIIAGPEDHIYECTNSDTTIKYSTYQIMFGLELLTDIPEDFMKRMESLLMDEAQIIKFTNQNKKEGKNGKNKIIQFSHYYRKKPK